MATTFEERLRERHPIGPEWQNPEQVGVGDAISLMLEADMTINGTVVKVRPYRDEQNDGTGTLTFVEVSFEGVSSGPEWIEVSLVTKQWDADMGEEHEHDEIDRCFDPVTPTRSSGAVLRTQRFANQKLVRMGSENVKGTIDMVLMGIPYQKLYHQFVEKESGIGELCDVIEETLVEFFNKES